MTPRLKEIAARAEAATPGPWVGDEFEMTAPKAPTLIKGNVRLVWADDYHMNEWDADFISHARSDIPYLLSEIARRDEQLRAARLRFEAILAPYTIHATDEDLGCPEGCYCDKHIALQALREIGDRDEK